MARTVPALHALTRVLGRRTAGELLIRVGRGQLEMPPLAELQHEVDYCAKPRWPKEEDA
jgi:hypothetical protein